MTPEEQKALDTAAENIKAAAKTEAKTAATEAVAEVKNTATEAKTTADAAKTAAEAAKKAAEDGGSRMDDLETKLNRLKMSGTTPENEAKGGLLADFEAKSDAIKNRQRGVTVEFDLSAKGVNDMLTAPTAPGRVIPPAAQGFMGIPNNLTHVRPLLQGGNISSPLLTYVRETGFTGSPGVVAEGATKPQVKIATEEKSAAVRKIAAYFKVSTELMADFPALISYLTGRVQEKLAQVEDQQLLYGDNTGQNLQGIMPLATTFSAGSIDVESPQIIDVIRAAVAQVRRAQYRATAVLMNPDDLAQLELTKDANGQYLLPTVLTGSVPSIGRVQLIEVDAINPGEFLVGSFGMGAQVFEREGLTVRMFDQNEADAINNMVTIVIEERLVQAVYRPESFVKGTFDTAATALAAA